MFWQIIREGEISGWRSNNRRGRQIDLQEIQVKSSVCVFATEHKKGHTENDDSSISVVSEAGPTVLNVRLHWHLGTVTGPVEQSSPNSSAKSSVVGMATRIERSFFSFAGTAEFDVSDGFFWDRRMIGVLFERWVMLGVLMVLGRYPLKKLRNIPPIPRTRP